MKRKINGRRKDGPDCTAIQDQVMLPAESYEMLEELKRRLREEYSPSGLSEEQLVNRLAVLFFERQRLNQYHTFKVEMRHADLRKRVPQALFLQKIKAQARAIDGANTSKEIEWYLSVREGTSAGKVAPNLKRNEDIGAWCEDVVAIPEEPADGRGIFIKLAEEFPVLERVKQLEYVDAIIDRTMKRLMQAKTMKQMYRQLEPTVISPRQLENKPRPPF